jgi:hypothetical protein
MRSIYVVSEHDLPFHAALPYGTSVAAVNIPRNEIVGHDRWSPPSDTHCPSEYAISVVAVCRWMGNPNNFNNNDYELVVPI